MIYMDLEQNLHTNYSMWAVIAEGETKDCVCVRVLSCSVVSTPCTVVPQAPLSRENTKCAYFLCWFATLITAVGFWVMNGRILVPCTVELRHVALYLKNKKVKF